MKRRRPVQLLIAFLVVADLLGAIYLHALWKARHDLQPSAEAPVMGETRQAKPGQPVVRATAHVDRH